MTGKIFKQRQDTATQNTVFTSPDYFKNFCCKCGECRHVCCASWGITLSLQEYYGLLGVNCSHTLRKKLDCAFILCDNANQERYMKMVPAYDGKCRLLRDDGLCGIQKELGEAPLPSVCRRYPRSYKSGYTPEAVCSSSCEAVTEALLRKEKLVFEEISLLSSHGCKAIESKKCESETRARCTEILQDREKSLCDRAKTLGRFLCGYTDSDIADLGNGLDAVDELLYEFSEVSPAMAEQNRGVTKVLGFTGKATQEQLSIAAENYKQAEKRLRAAFPDLDCYLENIAVNHTFYEQFPFIADCGGFDGAFASFCCAYALVKVVSVCCIDEQYRLCDLVDVISEAFRYIEHSAFYRNCDIILKRLGYLQPKYLYAMTSL